MNGAQALGFITARLHPDDDPALDPSTLLDLLALAATSDPDGNTPDATGWTPTYTVRGCYVAIAEGWGLKRGRTVGRFEFTTDGQTFRRQQVHDQIDFEHRRWLAKVQSCVSTLEAPA